MKWSTEVFLSSTYFGEMLRDTGLLIYVYNVYMYIMIKEIIIAKLYIIIFNILLKLLYKCIGITHLISNFIISITWNLFTEKLQGKNNIRRFKS